MQMNITFRQFGASDSLKEYAREKVDRVNRLLDRAGEAHVVLSLERHLHHANRSLRTVAVDVENRSLHTSRDVRRVRRRPRLVR